MAVERMFSPRHGRGFRRMLSLRNGASLAVEQPFGEGLVVVVFSTASPVWNNWSRGNPSWVVVMLELENYLAQARRRAESLVVGDPVSVSLQSDADENEVDFIVPPQGSIVRVSAEENEKKEGDLKAEKLVSKIQKLLSLAGSSNPHESEAATLKANELMINYNLERLRLTNHESHENEETAYVKRILHGKKNSAKYHAIYDILLLFMVKPVFNYGKDGFYLEVIGEKSNVLIAEYIGSYLDNELERLWKKQKELTPHLKGLSMKNSFMRGVAKGYKEKMELSKRKLLEGDKNLILLEGSLQTKVNLVYPRLSHTTSQRGAGCQESEHQGKNSGKGLFIPRALSNKGKNQKHTLILNSP